MTVSDATLDPERQLVADLLETDTPGPLIVAGMDEVGRGALAGPVAVGITAVDIRTAEPLEGLRDSKKLTQRQRNLRVDAIRDWGSSAVGWSSAQEIDEFGLSAALGLAGRRAIHELLAGIDTPLAGLILDGNSNWLNNAPTELVEELDPLPESCRIQLMVKADATSATVAAAAITAKVARDTLMAEIAEAHPEYGWASNKGYGSKQHREALATLGVTEYHRISWNLVPDPTVLGVQDSLL